MREVIQSIDQIIETLSYEIIFCAILFNFIWFIVWLRDLHRWLQSGHTYRRWYILFDFATPIYLLLLLILKIFDINIDTITIAHHLALTCSLQVGLGISRRLDMEKEKTER